MLKKVKKSFMRFLRKKTFLPNGEDHSFSLVSYKLIIFLSYFFEIINDVMLRKIIE